MMDIRAQLVSRVDVREYFHGAVRSALQNQQFDVTDETAVYLGNLLTSFVNTSRLFDHTPDGVMIRPLTAHYQEALEARTAGDRTLALRRLGDIALFISGLYANSLSRSLVDIDYYIAMGGNAYSYLSDNHRPANPVLQQVFAELAQKFPSLLDILSEVSESSRGGQENDILRLYEIWMKSGSPRAAARLKQAGVQVINTGMSRH